MKAILQKVVSVSILLMLFVSMTKAQDLPDENVEVVKEFEARLADANKVPFHPVKETAELQHPTFRYDIAEKILPVAYDPPVLKPLSMKTEPPPPIYNGFIKAGYGYPSSPYLDAGYYFVDRDDRSLLARISHHSANDKSIENLRFSDNDVNLTGRIVTDYGFAIEGAADVSLDNHFFYGYNRADTSFTKEEISNKLTYTGLGLKIYNVTENRSKINYWTNATVYRLGNEFDTRETALNLDIGLTKWLGNFPVSVTIGTDQTALRDTIDKRTLSNFYLGTYFSFGTDNLRAKVGAKLGSSGDELFFYPDAELLLNLVGNNLSVFVGAGGELRSNTYKTLTDYNPFMVPRINALENTSFFDFYGGLKGLVAGLEFSAQAGYKPIKNLGLFEVNLDRPWARFDVLYDTVNVIYFQGSVKGELFPKFSIGGNIIVNRFDAAVQDKAWFLPQVEGKAGVSYLALEDKLRIKADVFARNSVSFQELDLEDQPNALFDVSLGADFYVLENVGFFLQLNNLAANRYRRWYNYPTQSFNVLGGVTARF